MIRDLTDRQRDVLAYVVNQCDAMGRPPTGPEIAEHFGFSDHSSAYQYLETLERKGYIQRVQHGRGRQTGIRVLARP